LYPTPTDLQAEVDAAAQLVAEREAVRAATLDPSSEADGRIALIDPGWESIGPNSSPSENPGPSAGPAAPPAAETAGPATDAAETAGPATDAVPTSVGAGAAAPPASAGSTASTETATSTETAAVESERPAFEIPVLRELDLEAFEIAPRGAENDAMIVAFYGHPRSEAMGILGEYPLPQMARKLMAVAKEYDDANGEQAVLPAFHIIYATVWENADVGILDHDILQRYIDFAEEHGFAIFLDHQLGRHDVVKSVQSMLPFLRYESVHLAIDPEWSTLRPGKEIGSVTAAEINAAQQTIQDYLIEHDIPGDRMFIVHQFNAVMIQNRDQVRTDFERVRLVHNADGIGPPAAKIRSWQFNVLARNLPVKGFKLFYPKAWRDGGFDYPLMSVDEVLDLDPRPSVIMYQ
jgi:hypothetical protein